MEDEENLSSPCQPKGLENPNMSWHKTVVATQRRIRFMNEINRLEKDSLLYYQGGGRNITLSPEDRSLREFYDVDYSYIVINALLMPGLSNERARLKEEKRRVDLVIFEHMDELIEVYCRLYSAMCKYTFGYSHKESYHTYRADRMNTLTFLEQGQAYSFMSTKKEHDSSVDFHDKDGILLLEVETPGDIEHVDMNEVLGKESVYQQEQEILFAPFVLLDKEMLEITEEEKTYRDIHGNPPKAKYLLHLRISSIVSQKTDKNSEELRELFVQIMDEKSMNTVKTVWNAFMGGNEPEEEVMRGYGQWKEKLRSYLRLRFAGIKYEMTDIQRHTGEGLNALSKSEGNVKDTAAQEFQWRVSELEADILNYYEYTNTSRIKYKKYVQRICVALAIISPLISFFVALSFQEELQLGAKVMSLLLSAISVMITMVAGSLAWSEKFQQRTVTYLQLDELLQDMKYEKFSDENTWKKYFKRFRRIVSNDNRMGQENAAVTGKHLDNKTKEIAKKQEIENGKEG